MVAFGICTLAVECYLPRAGAHTDVTSSSYLIQRCDIIIHNRYIAQLIHSICLRPIRKIPVIENLLSISLTLYFYIFCVTASRMIDDV